MVNKKQLTRVCSVAALSASALIFAGGASALDSKWTIESILSARDIEISARNPAFKVIDNAIVDRQLAEAVLRNGDTGTAIKLLESSIATLKQVLKSDDPRIQSARLALAEAALNGKNERKCLSNLRLYLQQRLAADRKEETRIRKKLSQNELREEGVESQFAFEQRYKQLESTVERNPADAAMHQARLVFWKNGLSDALRLTRLALWLAGRDIARDTRLNAKTNNRRAEDTGIVRREALFLQALIYFGQGKQSPLLDARLALKKSVEGAKAGDDEVWTGRLILLDALLADSQGNRAEAEKLYATAIDALKKRKDRYDELLVRAYQGNNLMITGNMPEAYRNLNRGFEAARRLVEGREKGLLYKGLGLACFEGMNNTLLVRMSFEPGKGPNSNSVVPLNPSAELATPAKDAEMASVDSTAMLNGKPAGAMPCIARAAENLLLETRPYKEDYDELANALYHVGYQHKVNRRQSRAQELFWQAIYIYEKYLPDRRRELAGTLYDLAESYGWSERHDVSVLVFRRCADLRKEIDPSSTDYIMTLNTLGRHLMANGETKEAIDCLQKALHLLLHREEMQASRIKRIVSGIKQRGTGSLVQEAPLTVSAGENLRIDTSGERYSQLLCAMPLTAQLDAVTESRRRCDPDTCPQIDDLWQVLADSYSRHKSYDEASEVSDRLLKLRKDSGVSSKEEILGSLWQLAYICGVSNKLEDAREYYTEMIEKHKSSAGRSLPDWYYARGVVADSLGQWKAASEDFKRAIAGYKKYQKKLDKVEQKESFERAGWMISDLKEELKAKSKSAPDGPDYVDGYPHHRWGLDRFPLKVYIDDTQKRGFGPKLYARMKQAVDQWAETEGMKDKFVFVDDREKADIYFERVSNYDLIPYGSGGGASASFVQRGKKKAREIDKVHLRLYCRDYDLDKMSNHAIHQLFTLALHEFGHGLGLGHSPSGLDVMYWKSAMNRLSSRDRDTLLKIYGFQVANPD